VEIKPLSNGGAPMSASVDELRATVENLSLSPAPTVSRVSYSRVTGRVEAARPDRRATFLIVSRCCMLSVARLSDVLLLGRRFRPPIRDYG